MSIASDLRDVIAEVAEDRHTDYLGKLEDIAARLERTYLDDPPFIVGVNADPPIRLRRFRTEGEAAAFIDTLEGAKDGRYYIDDMTQGEE